MQASKNWFITPAKRAKDLLFALIAVVVCCAPCFAVTFTDQTTALTVGGLAGWRPAWGDYNADGYVDFLYGERVFRNNGPHPITGNWSFTDVGHNAQGIWGDYDNDGDLDIYDWGRQAIYRYDGGKNFTPVSVPVISGTRYGAAWGDWNNDSYLDLYVAGGGGSNQPNAVLQGSVNGTFTTAWTTGANNSRAVTSTDVDRDGYQDVYVSNYWQSNKFYENPGVIGGSEWPIVGRGLQESPVGYTSGSSFGDFDNDGYMDAVTGNLDHGPQHSSSVYQNMGPSGSYQFTERFAFTGSDYQEAYNSPSLGDYDNDGDLDVLMTVWQNYGGAARLYRNDGNWNFTNVTAAEGLATNMGTSGGNEGAAWADFDNDGDLDLLAGDRIWTNAGNNNHWLKVKLTGDGTTVNKAAIGSSVRVSVAGKTMTRQVEGGTGVGYQNDLTLHFGLGSHGGPVDLEITPPGGKPWTVQGVAVDQTLAYEVTAPEVETLGRIPPGKIAATSTEQWWEFGGVNVVYDGTGLTGGLHDTDVKSVWGAGGHPWKIPPNGMNNGNGSMATIQFSFDHAYSLDGLNIWNLGDWMGGAPDGEHIGTKRVWIEYSTVDNPSTTEDWSDWYVGNFAEQASDVNPYPVTQVLDLANVSAKHVALNIITDQGYRGGGVYVGLAELQFLVETPGIIHPAKITATSTEEWWEFGGVNVVYDGTGLTGDLHDTDVKSAWGAGGHPWKIPPNGMNDGNGSMATIQFTFDHAYLLDGLNIWNLGDEMGGDPDGIHIGTKSVVIEYSTADNPSTAEDWSDWYIGDFAEQASDVDPYSVTQVLDLANVSAKHVALSIITDQGYRGGGVYVGLAELQFLLVSDTLSGDIDGDGDVDGDDFLLWQNGFPISVGAALLDGDTDGDGDVDGDDFLTWQNSFPYPAVLSAVPEPNSLVLLTLGGLIVLRRQNAR